MDSYKRLEKLCSEIMSNSKGVTSYIEEMQNTPCGIHYVKGWNEDLKKLKHYRWVRNNIAHEPGCTEQDMCEQSDTLWINNFRSRIMTQTDPLALYYQATKKQSTLASSYKQTERPQTNTVPKKNYIHQRSIKHFALAAFISFLLFILCIIAILYFVSQSSFNYI